LPVTQFETTLVNNLVSVISGFYDESEIINAKTILHEVASKLTDDPDIPRLKTRRAGDNRRKLDAEDILSLFTCLDAKMIAMPLFAAVKSSRLPSIKQSETDVYFLTASVAELRGQLAEIMCSLKVLIDSNLRSQVLELTAFVTQLQTQMAEVVCSSPVLCSLG